MIESIGVRRGGGASREDKARKRDIDTRTMLGLPAELYWQPLGLEHGRIPASCGQVEVNSWAPSEWRWRADTASPDA